MLPAAALQLLAQGLPQVPAPAPPPGPRPRAAALRQQQLVHCAAPSATLTPRAQPSHRRSPWQLRRAAAAMRVALQGARRRQGEQAGWQGHGGCVCGWGTVGRAAAGNATLHSAAAGHAIFVQKSISHQLRSPLWHPQSQNPPHAGHPPHLRRNPLLRPTPGSSSLRCTVCPAGCPGVEGVPGTQGGWAVRVSRKNVQHMRAGTGGGRV